MLGSFCIGSFSARQELERQNEKLAKEKEELEKKVESKSADSGKMKESAPEMAERFTAGVLCGS